MIVSDSGADIFMRIKNGNGTFIAAPAGGPVTLSSSAAIAPDGVTVTIAAPASTSTLVVGATLTGGGFPAGTTVQSIVNATTFVASQAGTPIASPPGTTLQVGTGNTGNGIVSQGVVTSPAAITGHTYQVTFGVATGTITYGVTDTTTGAALSAGNPYIAGQAISFDGMQFNIVGTPANGDTFSVSPSANESIFQTISDLIAALGSTGTPTQFTNSLNKALNSLDRDLENVLTVRASLGSRLQELDALQNTGEDLGLQFKQSLSQLQDVDYNKAITDLTRQQANLQAAQKSYQLVSDLSLFNYL
jgi:flagellin-like hook-associated protein FlgL